MNARDAVTRAVLEVLPLLSAHDVADERSLRDLGADSVERVEILSLVSETLGSPHPLSAFADIPDIGALVTFLEQGARE